MARRAPLFVLGLFLFLPIDRRIAKCRVVLTAAAALMLAPMLHAAPRAMRMVTDEIGRRVEVPVDVRRVVSLAPNVTDILYSLGAGAKIAGVTDFAAIPPGNSPKPIVGEPLDPSLERIVALKPDLVFASRTINREQTVESLEQLGIPVYVTDAHSVEGMLHSVRRVADLIGMAPAGEQVVSRLQEQLNALRAQLAGRPVKRVLFVVWEDPLITTGEHTFIADALRWAGARSAVKLQEGWPHLSLEEVVYLQPEYLIFPATSSGAAGNIAQALRNRAGWRDLKAVREGHVVLVSDAINMPSPKLVGAIEQLARKLHPAAFSNGEPSRTLSAGQDGR